MNDNSETDWELLLSGSERAQMLQDIAQVSLAVGRHLFPDARHDDLDIAARSLLTRKSPVERLGFIARTLPALTQTVEQIACAPLTLPQTTKRQTTPPERARRLDSSELMRLARRGSGTHGVLETIATLSPDTPENRAVRSFLHILRRDASAVGKMAEAAGEAEITETARLCATRLWGLLVRFGCDENTQEERSAWIATPTHRMLAHPAYAQIAQWMRRYRQDFGFDWDTPLFQLPARETWRLYEAWGLFQALGALLTLGCEPLHCETRGTTEALFAIKNDRLLFRLAKGEESGVALRSAQGHILWLYYNRAYPTRRRSLSRTMQPDITVEDAAGDTWVLDPKFKAYAAPGDEGSDIDQMHAYRDAIIDADGRKPVQRAWCLYAGPTEGRSRSLISYGEGMAGVVGALRLRPGDGDSFGRLCDLIASWGVT